MRIFGMFGGLAAMALCAACAGQASANDGAWLERQISNARRGAVIEIPAGEYDLTDVKISRSVTLRGASPDTVILRSAEVTEKGILVPLSGVDLTIENITFEGARSWDRNGAGVRHEGRNLTVDNCRFVGNEDGILSTGAASGVITITNSAFLDNGFGDGQSHGIYVVEASALNIADSRFEGTRIGHHVKSLAAQTTITGTFFNDAAGRSSYAIDASKGGNVVIRDNTFIQSSDADNYTIINYDLTRGGGADGLTITDNKVTNYFDGGVFLRNDTRLTPVMAGNSVTDKGAKQLSLTSPGSPRPSSK